ncbi:MAG: septum site-determining protein MinC, partial [Gammaproteobacteria bacterium]|nr:septum site-determining protein MinC [Gammaproteobacteria bacterium]
VYGPLRGRALAGVMNNNNAHIFCYSLEAELASIGGAYQVSENLRDSHWKQPVHIYLNEGNLQIDKM